MRNPVLVLLITLEHKFIPSKITGSSLYKYFFINTVYPYPFERWCVYCRRTSYCWWKEKEEWKEERECVSMGPIKKS